MKQPGSTETGMGSQTIESGVALSLGAGRAATSRPCLSLAALRRHACSRLGPTVEREDVVAESAHLLAAFWNPFFAGMVRAFHKARSGPFTRHGQGLSHGTVRAFHMARSGPFTRHGQGLSHGTVRAFHKARSGRFIWHGQGLLHGTVRAFHKETSPTGLSHGTVRAFHKARSGPFTWHGQGLSHGTVRAFHKETSPTGRAFFARGCGGRWLREAEAEGLTKTIVLGRAEAEELTETIVLGRDAPRGLRECPQGGETFSALRGCPGNGRKTGESEVLKQRILGRRLSG